MLTSARVPEPRDPTERPAPPYRRWAAQFRSQSRSVQGLIAYTVVAVAVCAIVAGVYLAEGSEAPTVVREIAEEALAPAAPRTVEPPPAAETKPVPLSDAGQEAADAAQAVAAIEATPVAERLDIHAVLEWMGPVPAVPESEFGIGGGTFGIDGGAYGGGSEYIAVSPGAARRAIRDYIGAGALEPLPMFFTYVVQSGDTMASIARRFRLQVRSVRINNMHIDDPGLLELEAELEVPVLDGLLYRVENGDALDALVERWQADKEATIAFDLNQLSGNPDAIRIGQRLLLVGGTRPELGGAYYSSLTAPEIWYSPVDHYERITDRFGTPRNNPLGFHTGVDFAVPYGTPIKAARAGTVLNSGWDGSYGQWIEIDHGDGIKSRYAHLSRRTAVAGQWVAIGQVIGYAGSTGYSTGPHLHFEILENNRPISPHGILGIH